MFGGLLIEVLLILLVLLLDMESFFSFALVSRSRRSVDFEVTTVPVEETRDSGLVIVVVDAVDGEWTTLRIFFGDSALARFVEETRDSGLVIVVVDAVDGEWTTLCFFFGASAVARFEDVDGLTDEAFFRFTDLFYVPFCEWRLEDLVVTFFLYFLCFAGCRRSDEEDFGEFRFLIDDDFFPPCDPELDDALRWVSVLEELHFPLSRDEPFFTASLLSSESDDDIFKVNLDTIFMTTV